MSRVIILLFGIVAGTVTVHKPTIELDESSIVPPSESYVATQNPVNSAVDMGFQKLEIQNLTIVPAEI